MQYGLVLPLSGIEGDIERLVESAHVAEEEGWDGIFLEDYMVYWGSQGLTYDPWLALTAIGVPVVDGHFPPLRLSIGL